jgi:mevalonate kinase
MVHMGYGEAWAKVILMGEHSVVYGYPAVAAPLPSLKMRAWVTPVGLRETSCVGTLKALNYEGSLSAAGDRFGGLECAVKVATEFAGCPGLAFDVVTDSSFPAGRGMGSSAASAGAVIRAILDACDVRASEQEILRLTNEAEVITHGNPSGLDAVTTCSHDIVTFQSGQMQYMSVDLPAYLVIADSGIAGSTREAVGNVRRADDKNHAYVRSVMDELGELALASETDLEFGAVNMLGERMNRAHELLSQLDVSHPLVDHLVDAARDAGADGAKMTGGGLGGCLIALAENADTAQNVSRALLREGACKAWIHSLGAQSDEQFDEELVEDRRYELDDHSLVAA